MRNKVTARELSPDAAALAQAWRRFHECSTPETLAPRVFRSLVEATGSECGYMLLVDAGGDGAYLCAVRRLPDPTCEIVLEHEAVALLRTLPLLTTVDVVAEISGEAAAQIGGLDRSLGVAPEREQTGLWVNLTEHDDPFGFIRLFPEQEPGAAVLALATTLAQSAGWEFSRVVAGGDLVLEMTSRLLSRAIDAATGECLGHSRTVGECARTVAEHLGLQADRCRLTEIAACLHDYGKINALAELTEAPPRLNDLQRQQIRAAIREGIESLAEVRALRPVVDILLQTGEEWDGTGHPNGLRGEEIALEARIVSAVHRFYLALETRPHRSNMTALSQALTFLEERAGKEFDPQVVECLVREVLGLKGVGS